MKIERAKIAIRGTVQGVGFRPFLFRLATDLKLNGWVLNSSHGVFAEIEGTSDAVHTFLLRVEPEKPPRAVIQGMEASLLDPIGYEGFEIRESEGSGPKTTIISPDIATCTDCLHEILDPADRRYRYPFTNCTNCGPRFSIVEALPYDRPNTTMRAFAMCPLCLAEYSNPRDRRFHAQPIACPTCGPQLELWDNTGTVIAREDLALRRAARALRDGRILALKGIGGFQLLADASNEETINRLRQRKHREEKPFALMMPSLTETRAHCSVSAQEERLLLSPEAPIVLLDRRDTPGRVAPSVAPHNPTLGIMLPYSPLHHLLLRELGFAIVATSANLSDEPICTDEHDALERLDEIADLFLVHNRPIARHMDDSVARIILGRELVLRRARGYAPMPVHLTEDAPTILGVGAHLKNAVAINIGREVVISQHIGDLETAPAHAAFRRAATDLQRLYEATPELVACDLHPDYLSTRWAQASGIPTFPIQHHHAHLAACMAENEIEPPVLGVCWDGTGYGVDGTIWGGEFLLANEESFTRFAHLRTFRLPGGDSAVRQPRRAALGLLFEALGPSAFDSPELAPIRSFAPAELATLRRMLALPFNSPVTSSAGRLFDAVASLLDLRQQTNFEGQAAMELEFAADPHTHSPYPFSIVEDQPLRVDWAPMIQEIISQPIDPTHTRVAAARFHHTLAALITEIARRAGSEKVALSGGCFQNRLLTSLTVQQLRREGFRPYWHQRVPPNDGGIALGQIAATLAATRARPQTSGAIVTGYSTH